MLARALMVLALVPGGRKGEVVEVRYPAGKSDYLDSRHARGR